MGSSSWMIDLEPIGATPAARAQVKETTVRLLADAWRAALPASDYKRAHGWMSAGIDSLLTIRDAAEWDEEYEDDDEDGDDEDGDDEDGDDEDDDEDRDLRPATQIELNFYDSVSWAHELAEHWVARGLATCRGDLERALRELGYRVTAYVPADVEWRFVRENNRTGLVTSDGVEWQLPRCESVDDDALAPETRSAVDRVRATKTCECTYCVRDR